jgi:hypothetical protein
MNSILAKLSANMLTQMNYRDMLSPLLVHRLMNADLKGLKSSYADGIV